MTAIKSRRVVFSDGVRPATVVLSDGLIRSIEPYDTVTEAVDCGDDALLAGLVDTHVHINEPGRTEWEGFVTATAAAAAGGVTTLLDMPLNSLPPTLSPAALDVKRAAAQGNVAVDVGFWGGAVPANLGRLAELHAAGVYGFKCFLADSGVPEFPALTFSELDRALKEVSQFDGLLIVHAESGHLLRPAPLGPHFAGFLSSRPVESEVDAVRRLAELAAKHRARVHVLHVSAAGAADVIGEAKRDGVRITAETCPHYLTLDSAAVPDGATEYKCCPPIRDAANRERLWHALLDGPLDAVVSDHSPATPDLKLTGCFSSAWGGIASLQLGLSLMWTEASRRGYGLAEIARWCAEAPARLAGVAGKGQIAPGFAADLVRFNTTDAFDVDPSMLAHRHPVSPYAGRTLLGKVHTTWLAGKPITDSRSGRLLNRRQP